MKKGKTFDMKALCLILAYMFRLDEVDESVKVDLEYILSKAPFHLDQML